MYLPSVGVSSTPRIESRVDLPQPEGPAMDTYSPCRMSMWMPERAWVSTSSVRKTLVTPSSLMSDSGMAVGSWRFEVRARKSAFTRGVGGDKRDQEREDDQDGEH